MLSTVQLRHLQTLGLSSSTLVSTILPHRVQMLCLSPPVQFPPNTLLSVLLQVRPNHPNQDAHRQERSPSLK